MNFDLSFIYNTWFLVLGAIVLGALSWWVYKYTTPAIADFLRKILLVLRFVSIALVLALIFEPVLGLSWRLVEKPIIALLIDNSSSLKLEHSNGSREEEIREI